MQNNVLVGFETETTLRSEIVHTLPLDTTINHSKFMITKVTKKLARKHVNIVIILLQENLFT